MNWLELLLSALATWRLTRLVLYENGPFEVFYKIRLALGNEYNELGQLESYKYELATCAWCLSVWVGLAFTLAALFCPEWLFLLIATPFALSAVAVLLERVVTR